MYNVCVQREHMYYVFVPGVRENEEDKVGDLGVHETGGEVGQLNSTVMYS